MRERTISQDGESWRENPQSWYGPAKKDPSHWNLHTSEEHQRTSLKFPRPRDRESTSNRAGKPLS